MDFGTLPRFLIHGPSSVRLPIFPQSVKTLTSTQTMCSLRSLYPTTLHPRFWQWIPVKRHRKPHRSPQKSINSIFPNLPKFAQIPTNRSHLLIYIHLCACICLSLYTYMYIYIYISLSLSLDSSLSPLSHSLILLGPRAPQILWELWEIREGEELAQSANTNRAQKCKEAAAGSLKSESSNCKSRFGSSLRIFWGHFLEITSQGKK